MDFTLGRPPVSLKSSISQHTGQGSVHGVMADAVARCWLSVYSGISRPTILGGTGLLYLLPYIPGWGMKAAAPENSDTAITCKNSVGLTGFEPATT
jgi:hypothetical protein